MTEPDPVPREGIVAGEPEQETEQKHVPAGLGCARCGDCCEEVVISMDPAGFTAVVSTSGGMGVGKPGAPGRTRLGAIAGRYARDAAFIRNNMEPTGEVVRYGDGVVRQVWRCLKFDAEARACTAHDERPRMCSEYPWYGKDPAESEPDSRYPSCSYLLDVAPERRPEGSRPLIPLEVV